MSEKILFTSEAVSEGHPDKLCDRISDAILDFCLEHDENSRVACECFATTEYVLIGGEITCKVVPDYEKIARKVIREVGYTSPELGIGADTCTIDVRVKTQSPDIAQGIVHGSNILDIGAGDQGIMFGYATKESKGYMPLPISIAQKLVRVAARLRKEGKFPYARPDMKSEVTIDYTDANHIRVETVLMSIQHDPDYDPKEFADFVLNEIMRPVVASFDLDTDFNYLINPSGRFTIGGPMGDTGLTGRKIIVDTYGGSAKHGGGAFSGKDATKVDRSGAYMARYVAKNLVAAGVSDRLEIQVSYAIGVSEPLSINLATFRTAKYKDEFILDIIRELFDFRPGAIIQKFALNKPTFKYQKLSAYGHFGRPDLKLPWEQLDQVDAIKTLIKRENPEKILRVY
ncbi:MAG: methionine adenosyltransferase [Bacilli bacterium]|jgi:S-adenosylmethionine synthetase